MMENTDILQNLQSVIERYDHYIESAQSKGNLYIALNTFIIGGYVTLTTASNSDNWHISLFILAGIIVLFGVCSIITTLFALTPFLRSTNSDSIIYFKSVAKMDFSKYYERATTISDTEYIKDMTCQTYSLAKGLTKKYRCLSIVGFLLVIEFSLVLLWIYTFFLTH